MEKIRTNIAKVLECIPHERVQSQGLDKELRSSLYIANA